MLSALLYAAVQNSSLASDAVPKQVHLILDGSRLVASNIRFSRFDPLKLNARETVLDQAVGEAAIVVVTSQRVIGYGVLSGWRSVDRDAGEQVEEISAEDYAGLVISNTRFLNFNGESGVWAEQKRGVAR